MRKGIVLFLLCLLLLTACSSQGKVSSNDAKEQSIIKEVDGLIEEGQFSKAGDQIKKNNFLEKKNTGAKYNYNSLVTYLELEKLYEQEEYKKVLVKYTSEPIDDKFISKEVIKLIKGSFDELISKGYYITVEKYYDKLPVDTKDNFKDIYLAVLQHNNNQNKNTTSVTAPSNKIEQYLKYMNEGNYSVISAETATDLSNIGANFFYLSTAYDNFYNNPDLVYIKGQESIPESFLNNIKEPLPEVKPYIENLRNEIVKKQGSANDYGVIIGMSTEQVLNSSWGKPQKVNTTTTSLGTREQWVYGNGNYLYFENGILVTIQN